MFSSFASAKKHELSSMKQVMTLIEKESKSLNPKDVLVVFDIDNTLLAMNQHFGSDQWYEWQSELIKSGETKNAVGKSISELLQVLTMLYSVNSMRSTEPMVPSMIRALQSSGFRVAGLTARGPTNRDATLRELRRQKIDLAPTAFDLSHGIYKPFKMNALNNYGLGSKDIELYKLKAPRSVSYEFGLMMVAGQHKGVMLRTLLHRAKYKPKLVVFVDDKQKNVDNVDHALTQIGLPVHAVRYSKEDAYTQKFKQSSKASEIKSWKELSKTILPVVIKKSK